MRKKKSHRGNRKAHELLQLSAEQGFGPAHTATGRLYAAGQGVEQDYCKAEEYYSTANRNDRA